MVKKTSFQNVPGSWRSAGEGPALVLLHGFTEDHRVWLPVSKALEAQYRLILPDLHGSGGTSWPAGGSSMEQMADWVSFILEEEKVTEAVVIGHSMGGYVTLALAERAPEKCRAIGLFCSHPYADDEQKRQGRDRTIALIQEKGSGSFISSFVPGLFDPRNLPAMQDTVAELRAMNAEFGQEAHIIQLQAMRKRPDRTTLMKQWPKPMLVVGGKQDPILPYQNILNSAVLAPTTVFHGIEGAGHMVHYEKPEKTIALIDEFMKFTFH